MQPWVAGTWCVSGKNGDGWELSGIRMKIFKQGLQWVYEEEWQAGFGWGECTPLVNAPLQCKMGEDSQLTMYGYRCRAYKVS